MPWGGSRRSRGQGLRWRSARAWDPVARSALTCPSTPLACPASMHWLASVLAAQVSKAGCPLPAALPHRRPWPNVAGGPETGCGAELRMLQQAQTEPPQAHNSPSFLPIGFSSGAAANEALLDQLLTNPAVQFPDAPLAPGPGHLFQLLKGAHPPSHGATSLLHQAVITERKADTPPTPLS